MASFKLCPTFILLATLLYSVYGKGSLTYVVDDTASMYDVIQQIKDETDSIFNLLESSEVKPYENVVLVTFNDPGALLRTVTTDRKVFKRALEDIQVDGGNDCPEYALTGIKLAIESSLPYSTLYVFTDASAKDYMMYDEVAAIVNEKNIKLNFILTGSCGDLNDLGHKVYNRLANLNSGFVTNISKSHVYRITHYVENDIKRKSDAELAANKI